MILGSDETIQKLVLSRVTDMKKDKKITKARESRLTNLDRKNCPFSDLSTKSVSTLI